MNFHYEYEEKAGYLLVVPQGKPKSAEEFGLRVEEMFREAAERGSRCLLVDRLGTEIQFEVLDLVNVSNFLDEQDLQNLGLRVAVLVDADNADLFNKLETSLTIRAFSYRIFGDRNKALAWLGVNG